MLSVPSRFLTDFVGGIPVGVKSFVTASILLVCMLSIGTNAYLTSVRSAAGLRILFK
jgi:hypothetical protein